ncbi:MAG: hypothetical protein N3A62_05900 [Thermodesulfovibrionales bacterium]|nr:hypothetical protein [Thermodesulfovibrionales bacterium]
MTVTATTDLLFEIKQQGKTVCPFKSDDICKASPLTTIDDLRMGKFCTCEDYEDCPMFLVKRLQGRV